MEEDIRKWLEEHGENMFQKLGVKDGMTVLDFGAREGYNSIPVAKIVGSKGKMISIDEDDEALNKLKNNASKNNLSNIVTINNKGNLNWIFYIIIK